MFKKFSKLMILTLGALTVFSACAEEEKKGTTPPVVAKTFLENVGGKYFDLVNNMTGGKNYVLDNGSIKSDDNNTVQFTFDSSEDATKAIYINGDGNYFGVEYVSTTTPLKFYFDNSAVPAGDYWADKAEVKFVVGTGVLLAAKTNVLINGPFTDNVTTEAGEVPDAFAISAQLAITSETDIKLLALADNKSVTGKGTLFTGTINFATFKINIDSAQVEGLATKGMKTDSLQMVSAPGGGPAPVIINSDKTKVTLYDENGREVGASGGLVHTLPAIAYVAGVSHIAIQSSHIETKLYKVTTRGFLPANVAITLTPMKPTSIVPFNGHKNILVAGTEDGKAVIDNVTLGENPTKTSIPITDVGSTVNDVELIVNGADLYAVVTVVTDKLYKFNGATWAEVTAIDHMQKPATLPTVITSVNISGSIMYITSVVGTTSTTTAYMITPTVLVKVFTPPTGVAGVTGVINNVVTTVAPAFVSLPAGAGVLVIDVENFATTTKVIRHNNFMTATVPFQMPPK